MKKLFYFLPFLLVFGCANSPAYTTEAVKIALPKILLQEVPMPALSVEAGQTVTNQDLLFYTLNLEQSLTLCNAKLSAIQKSVE